MGWLDHRGGRQRFPVVAVALMLAAWAACAGASPVAMVTDLAGKAAFEGASGRGSLAIMAELAPDAQVKLDSGAKLTVMYVSSGDEYAFSGPARIEFHQNAPQVEGGAPLQKRTNPLARAGGNTTLRLSSVTQAGFVMRGMRSTGRVRLLTLVGTRTLESSPEFRWQEAGVTGKYAFRLSDDHGAVLYETEVAGTSLSLPASVALRENTTYTWELSAQFPDGRRYISTGDFSLAPRELRAQAEALRPAADATVAERVLYAAWLEQAQLRDEAKKYWNALLAERPDDPNLRALAGRIEYAPRTVSDITDLLDQYRPDPARVAALRAILEREPPPGADTDALFRFYRKRAEAAQSLGMPERQIADLRRAEALVKGTEEEWNVAQDIYIAEVYSGNFASALRLKREMHGMVGNLRGRWITDYANTVTLYVFAGDIDAARSTLRDLEGTMFNLGRSPSWARYGDVWTAHLESSRARVLEAEGKNIEAETAHRKALAAAERFLASEQRIARGPDEAPFERVINFVEIIELRLAHNLQLQGRLPEAEVMVRGVLRRMLSRLGRYSPVTAAAVGRFAGILVGEGRFRDAEAMARAAIDIHRKIDTAPGAITYVLTRRVLGAALAAQGRWQEVLEVYRTMRADLAGDPETLEKIGHGDPNWALALIKSGRAQTALPMLEGGLAKLRQRFEDTNDAVAVRRGFLAMALAETGDRRRALDEYQGAVKVLLSRSGGAEGEEAGSSGRRWRLKLILEGYIKLLYDLRGDPRLRAGLNPVAEAFRVADAARGQDTQQALSDSAARAAPGDPALAGLVRREQDARRQIAVLYDTLRRVLNAPPDQQLPQVVAQMRSRIHALEADRQQVLSELERRFPAYVNLIHPRPATVGETQAALREGEVLLSVLTTDERTYVWAVPKSGPIGFLVADVRGDALAAQVAGLRKALDVGHVSLGSIPEFDTASAYRLYAKLFQPLEGAWKNARLLMVVADGALSQLPVGLLPTAPTPPPADSGVRFAGYREVPWLIKQIAVTQLPAVSTLLTLKALPSGNPGRASFAGFGDPQFGPGATIAALPDPSTLRMRSVALPSAGEGGTADWVSYSRLAPLPDTRDEIEAVAATLGADPTRDVFLGSEATRRRVMSMNLADRRIVEFATHGLVPGDFPDLDQPALALSAPTGDAADGLLTLSDILGLKLDADWVVLSACNTAAGNGQGAEAISGLGRGFFYAGSRALLVTYWPVETRSARLLVTTLFKRYASDPGLTRAEALREASLAVMQDVEQDAGGKPLFSYAHPMFWAPYALVGDGGR